jgi:hypothetical protein
MIFPVVDESSTKQLSLSILKDYVGTIPTTATTSTLGAVKGGNNILISSTGTMSFNGGIITGTVSITNLTPLIVNASTSTAAMFVFGGVGVGGDLGVGNNLYLLGDATVRNIVATGTITVSTISNSNTLVLSAANRVAVTRSPFRVWNVTTSTRNQISANNGDIIYNTGNNKFQGFANGVWVDLS